MNTSVFRGLAATLLLLCATGCGPSRMALKPDFWTQPQPKLAVATVVIPPLQAWRAGGQGLLDVAINNAMAEGLEAHLKTVDASRFHAVADAYVAELQARGITAQRLAQPVDLAALPPFKSRESGEFSERDLRSIGRKEGLDQLILLSVYQCGTMRSYYGFIPLGAPEAICMSKGELIDLKTNEVRWRAFPETNQATVKVAGEWDAPPDYRNITAAIDQAITQAQDFLLKDFFGPRPMKRSAATSSAR